MELNVSKTNYALSKHNWYSQSKVVWLFLIAFSALTAAKAQTEKTIYTIGNSLTDNVGRAGLKAIAAQKGYNAIIGRHTIPGAPLGWTWTHPEGCCWDDPYGRYQQALSNYTWDALTLQPFIRNLDADVPDAIKFINYAKEQSPDIQPYIYAQWPSVATVQANGGWAAWWLRDYEQGNGAITTKDYYETLTLQVREQNPSEKPVLLIPVGHVMYALHLKMQAGQVPGYNSILQVYKDDIHLIDGTQNDVGVGGFLVGTTFFATIFKSDPRGLTVPTQYGPINPTVASIIQETVWEVVTNHPLSGVTGDDGGGPVTPPVLREPENPSNTVAGLDYTYYEGTWSNLPDFNTLTAAETGNVANFDLSIRNRDDNFGTRFTGYIDVPTDGTYTFYTTSDDGSKLYIGNTEVVNNNGLHGAQERSGTIGLKAGKHAITVTFFEAAGQQVLTASYAGPNINKQTIPAAALSRVPQTTNNPPVAVISATPISGDAPLTVTFNGSGSSDPDAEDNVFGYEWDFGDGSIINTSLNPTHTYTTPGSYIVSLRVVDTRGLYGSPVTTTITVTGTGTGDATTYLSDLTWVSAVNGHGPVEKDKSVGEAAPGDGNTMRLNGVTYSKGLGAHSPSEIVYNLDGDYSSFLAQVGIDDEVGESSCGSAVFEVYVDNELEYSSGTMNTTTATKSVNVNVAGKNQLKLVVTTAGDNNYCDHVNWADARLTTAAGARTSFEAAAQTMQVSLYPNPTREYVRLQFTAPAAGKAKIAVRNSLGQSQLQVDRPVTKGVNVVELRVPGIRKGVHMVVLELEGKKRLTQKIVVE